MATTPSIVCDFGNHTGEGPLWHPEQDSLYWVDIPKGALYRYHPETGNHGRVYKTDMIGGFTIQDDGNILLFESDGKIEIYDVEQEETNVIVQKINQGYHFNDVIADPEGRVFCGTKRNDTLMGNFYRLDVDGSLHKLREDVNLSNGLGFNGEENLLYHTESGRSKIWKFDYDRTTGELSNKSVFIDVENEQGFPDGMTVDNNDDIWSARWNGGCLVRYSPSGKELGRVEFPAQKVSSLTFGGEDYETAYVTTALGPGESGKRSKQQEGSGAGAVFEVDLGVGGRAEYRSRIHM